jgi:cation diffusion facilitator family transporter
MTSPDAQSGPAQTRRARRAGPRRSAATLRACRNPGNVRSLAIAFVANVVVAAAKLAAGLITGSAALLAEAAHSGADSSNEILLGGSLRYARRPPDDRHPFGYGRTRFLGAFLAAVSSFLIGGCLSVGLAIRDLANGSAIDHLMIAWVVLAIAAAADGFSLGQTVRQATREASRWGQSTVTFLRTTTDPTLRALAVEDAAALIGVAIAAAGLAVHQLGGPASSDAIASLLIGILLAATAGGLARPLADLLIGKSLSPARLRRARDIINESPAIDEILDLYATVAGPQEAILAAKAHPAPGQTADQLAGALDAIDQRLRSELPEVGEVFIDVTAHRRASPP